MIDPNHARPAARPLLRALVTGCLVISSAALCACSQSTDCSGGAYRGGCAPGTPLPASASPPLAAPAAASPTVSTAPAGAGAVGRGDPSAFADVDDRQCRSYGLTFGTRDYADCRIRLSAQHRGLDPNIGTTPNSR